MQESTVSVPRTVVGIDLGDRKSCWVRLGARGDVEEEGSFSMDREHVRRAFAEQSPCRIVLEVGTHSRWVEQELTTLGHEVLVANARQVRLIHAGGRKNDRLDAEKLARLGRYDPALLHPIQHRGESCQRDLVMIRARQHLVRTRTRLACFLRGQCKSFGIRLVGCNPRSLAKKARSVLPAHLEPALGPLLDELERVTARITWYDKQIEALCRDRYPETELLRQVNGVGPITALCFVLSLEDPHRYARNRVAGAFLGLHPRQYQSGGSDPQLRITKAGNKTLRCLLVQSAQHVLGPFGKDSDLRRFGERLKARGGKAAHKRAVVAVARKLAVLLLSLWRSGRPYEPLRNHPQELAA